MATYLPGNNQPVSFPENPAPPRGPQDATYAPSYGVGGLSSDLEVRARELSLLVEVNAALAGALDVESVLGTILARLADRERLSHARIYRLDGPAGGTQGVAGEAGTGHRRASSPSRTLH